MEHLEALEADGANATDAGIGCEDDRLGNRLRDFAVMTIRDDQSALEARCKQLELQNKSLARKLDGEKQRASLGPRASPRNAE